MTKKNKLLYTSAEWTVDSVQKTWDVIDKIAREELGLDYYPPQIELITFDQMIDAYSTVGMPIFYQHWSFGKSFINTERAYKAGEQGLAYEMVINSDPAVCYCLETNTSTMQALVLAHAACGHVNFFKNNYLFKEWTDASSIIPYLKYAKEYVDKCIETHGADVVEDLLDACHALQNYGVDLFKRPKKKSQEEYFEQELERLKFKEQHYKEEHEIYPGFSDKDKIRRLNEFQNSLDKLLTASNPEQYEYSRGFPEENILYFLEKKSPVLMNWEKEIVRIVRNIAQYFHPQRQTKVMNEGWASFIHYTIMNILHDRGYISGGNMLEFLHSHTNVCCQHDLNPLNPYTLGFSIFSDIKRMCLEPTEEDKEWFPDIAGQEDWLTICKDIVKNYRDESFILQFLSPKVIRDLKLFSIRRDSNQLDENGREKDYYEVMATHRVEDIKQLRLSLSQQYQLDYYRPNIQITSVDWTMRVLTLTHFIPGAGSNVRDLDDSSANKVWSHLIRLWGFDIDFEQKITDVSNE